jgi:ATP-binding cassette subfamily C protein CydD
MIAGARQEKAGAAEETGREERACKAEREDEAKRAGEDDTVDETQRAAKRERAGEPGKAGDATRVLPLWSNDAELTARNLGFTYDGAHEIFEALHAVSFEVSGFTKVGIIGASGAGKSTLINLLAGFSEPSAGILHVNGAPVCSLKRPDWQEQIALLPQNPYIFHATLRENLVFYHPEASDAEVQQAVAVVDLEDLIAELPQGLDTRIGEGARALSGGQAQRVALARVCLDTRRRILLFDEPTAHLDIETELELKQRMLALTQEKLVFFATHRLHWMQNMDLIWVLDGGTIVESGTFEELRARGGYFTSLVRQLEGGAA